MTLRISDETKLSMDYTTVTYVRWTVTIKRCIYGNAYKNRLPSDKRTHSIAHVDHYLGLERDHVASKHNDQSIAEPTTVHVNRISIQPQESIK